MAGASNKHNDWKFSLEERMVEFSSSILNLLEQLHNDRQSLHIANQLLRSGTSVAPNYAEALGAESRRDFVHKMSLSVKELRETFVWLRLIRKRQLTNNHVLLDKCINECNELIAIFVASINTAKKNLRER